MERKHIFHGLLVLVSVIIAAHSISFEYDMNLVTDHCLLKKPLFFNYTPIGEEYEIGNLTIYDSNPRNSRRLLVAVYDIFGMSNQLKYIADALAERYDFRVVLPDMLRGKWWEGDLYPPPDPERTIWEWLERNASWDKVVQYDIANVMNTMESRHNLSHAGIFGTCWGGRVSTWATELLSDQFLAAGLIHPSWINNTEAVDVKSPMWLFPSRDERDMLPFYEVLREKFGNNSGHIRYDDMDHGFAGARGNWTDVRTRSHVEEIILILGDFFDRNIPNQ